MTAKGKKVMHTAARTSGRKSSSAFGLGRVHPDANKDQSPPPPPPPPPKREHRRQRNQQPTASTSAIVDDDASHEGLARTGLLEDDEDDDEEADHHRGAPARRNRNAHSGKVLRVTSASDFSSRRISLPPYKKRTASASSPRQSADDVSHKRSRPILASTEAVDLAYERDDEESSADDALQPFQSDSDDARPNPSNESIFISAPPSTHRGIKRRYEGSSAGEDSASDLGLDSFWPFNNQATGNAPITWSEHEDAEAIEDDDAASLQRASQEDDMEELLAWGTGELELAGMPNGVASDPSQPHWFEDAPYLMDFELDTSSDADTDSGNTVEVEHDAESALDSSEEVDQLLAVRGLCDDSDDSLDGGNTTDSLDDADHDGLVRFGIEQGEDETSYWTPKPKKKKSKKNQKGASKDVSVKVTSACGPIVGVFEAAVVSGTSAVLSESDSAIPIMSPYSVTRPRRLRRLSSGTSPSRMRRTSVGSSRSTVSAPSLQLDRWSPPPDIAEEDGEEHDYVELELGDLLDASMLVSPDIEMVMEESDTDTDTQTHGLSDLTRWDRVPIGAFRRSRAIAAPGSHASVQQVMRRTSGVVSPFANGSASFYLPVATAIFAAQSGLPGHKYGLGPKLKRKITRREAIGLSPVLCPVRTQRVPSAIKSRKGRRADAKAAMRKRVAALPAPVNDPPSCQETQLVKQESDADVPMLDLPEARLSSEERSSSSAPSSLAAAPVSLPAGLLPVPTLPSAGCVPLGSPLFSAAVRPEHEVPRFTLEEAI